MSNTTLCRITGPLFKSILEVKTFKTRQAMHDFLNKQYDNSWCEAKPEVQTLKSGKYTMLGGKWVRA